MPLAYVSVVPIDKILHSNLFFLRSPRNLPIEFLRDSILVQSHRDKYKYVKNTYFYVT